MLGGWREDELEEATTQNVITFSMKSNAECIVFFNY